MKDSKVGLIDVVCGCRTLLPFELMKMESVVQREDPSVDVVTLETPNLTSLIGTNSATLPRKFSVFEM